MRGNITAAAAEHGPTVCVRSRTIRRVAGGAGTSIFPAVVRRLANGRTTERVLLSIIHGRECFCFSSSLMLLH